MSDDKTTKIENNYNFGLAFVLPVGIGVFWYVWGLYGFWWGLLYGFFWMIWAGYRLAQYLLPIII